MKMIGVVTGSRSDYGILFPILRKIISTDDLKLHLIVTGMHLSPEFGLTVNDILKDGFNVDEKVEMLLSSDSPEGIAKSIGLGTIGFAQCFRRFRPDILLVVGDRFEMFSAVLASLPFNIPIAHIHGGEITEGAIDEVIRHSITKMSHFHFVSTKEYKTRVIQLGENPDRVYHCGAPSLDNLRLINFLSRSELEKEIGFSLDQPPLLVTYHPVTLKFNETHDQISILLSILKKHDCPIIFTYPNADTMGRVIIDKISQFVNTNKNAVFFPNLGIQIYFSLMKFAKAMIGNSSSGIIEAASFELPVVNIGCRQDGRVRGYNVIDVDCDQKKIEKAIIHAVSPNFQQSLMGMQNPYGGGRSSELIIEKLKSIALNNKTIKKKFYDFQIN